MLYEITNETAIFSKDWQYHMVRYIKEYEAGKPKQQSRGDDGFRRRQSNWPQKDLRSDDAILKEIPRWATRGVAAIYGRLFESSDGGSDPWPNKTAIKAVIESIDE